MRRSWSRIHTWALYCKLSQLTCILDCRRNQIAAYALDGIGGRKIHARRPRKRIMEHEGRERSEHKIIVQGREKWKMDHLGYWLLGRRPFPACLSVSICSRSVSVSVCRVWMCETRVALSVESMARIDCEPWLSIVFPMETLTDQTVDRMGASSDLSATKGYGKRLSMVEITFLFLFSFSSSSLVSLFSPLLSSLLMLLCPWTRGRR